MYACSSGLEQVLLAPPARRLRSEAELWHLHERHHPDTSEAGLERSRGSTKQLATMALRDQVMEELHAQETDLQDPAGTTSKYEKLCRRNGVWRKVAKLASGKASSLEPVMQPNGEVKVKDNLELEALRQRWIGAPS